MHLTSKPVALIHDLLAIASPDSIVPDPFMGGGSVGVACRESGRSHVGIELSEEYYAISRDRILQTEKKSWGKSGGKKSTSKERAKVKNRHWHVLR